MTPDAAYRQTLVRRLERLRRYALHGQDGHGNYLSAEGMRLVEVSIKASDQEWWASWCATEGVEKL